MSRIADYRAARRVLIERGVGPVGSCFLAPIILSLSNTPPSEWDTSKTNNSEAEETT